MCSLKLYIEQNKHQSCVGKKQRTVGGLGVWDACVRGALAIVAWQLARAAGCGLGSALLDTVCVKKTLRPCSVLRAEL